MRFVRFYVLGTSSYFTFEMRAVGPKPDVLFRSRIPNKQVCHFSGELTAERVQAEVQRQTQTGLDELRALQFGFNELPLVHSC